MVSLENRIHYLESIQGNEKLLLFYNVLANLQLVSPTLYSQTVSAQLFYRACFAVQSDDQNIFKEVYDIFSRREPSGENPQPYINDDFLIFIIIAGVIKFDIEKQWINKVIKVRNRTVYTITFENLINEDYFSKNNLPEIVICLLNIAGKDIPSEYLNSSYLVIVNNPQLLNNNDLIKIASFNAIDSIIVLKEMTNDGYYSLLVRLKKRVEKRLTILSTVTFNIILISLVRLVMYIYPHFPIIKKFIDDYVNLFGFLAFVGIVGANFIPNLKKWFMRKVFILFGYRKELLEEDKTNRSLTTTN